MTQNRYYSSPAQSTTLAANITSTSTTSISVTGNPTTLLWPSSFPYTIGVDWGTNVSEAMSVTAVAGSGPYTLTVVRGIDGTTAQTHSVQATNSVFHIVSGEDFGEPQTHMSAMGATTYPNTPSNTNVPVHGVTNTPSTSGQVVTSDSSTAASWKSGVYQAAGTYVTGVTGTAPVVSSGGTAPAISMAAATSSNNGYMTSTQAGQVITNWIDVTQQAANPVLASNSASANNAALGTILSNAPNGATIYFPGNSSAYQFTGAITFPAKAFTFQGQGQNRAGSPATAYTMLELVTNAGNPLFTLDATNYWYTSFNDICFLAGVTQNSTGACAVNVNGNVGVNFRRCSWQAASSSSWYNCINMLGDSSSSSGNQAVVDGCNFAGWTNYGIALSAQESSLVVTSSVFQGNQLASPAAAGIQCGWVGALQINNCDIVGCTNNLLINPVNANSEVAASIFVTNTYFDDSSGSCILITGTGPTVRCKFIECSFTVATGSTAYNAVQVNSTYAYTTTSGQGLDFICCNVVNTFGNTSTSTNGFNITGAADFRIIECNIAGWPGSGITVTPIATLGVTKTAIRGNTIGPCAGYGANGTGITLASSSNYGNISITNNDLSGNTTAAVSDSSTVTTSVKNINGNIGWGPLLGTVTTAATTTSASATIALVTGMQLYVPANSLKVGSTFRITFAGSFAAATTAVWTIKMGTAGTTGDATVLASTASASGTGQMLTFYVTIQTTGSSGTALGTTWVVETTAGTASAGTQAEEVFSTTGTVNTTQGNYLSLCVTGGATETLTARVGVIELIA
jgi:hypothetical protein